MKRSAQVALVLMGVTGTTAAGAYMMPPRPECRTPSSSSAVVTPPAAATPAGALAEQPCRRRSWGGWRWGSGPYSSYSSSDRSRPLFSSRAPTSISTALTGSRSTAISTGTSASRSTSTSSSSGSGTSRGGFGSTGHSMSGGHSGS